MGRAALSSIVILVSSIPCVGQVARTPKGLSTSEWSSIRAAYEANRHAAFAVEGGYQARNPGQQWRTRFDGRGFLTTPDRGDWSWGLELVSYGIEGVEQAVVAPLCIEAEGNRVAYQWGEALTEWYVNDQRGLEHGYTVHQRPDGGPGSLQLTLAVRGELRPQVSSDGRDVTFISTSGVAAVNYTGLKVFDANGAVVPAWFVAAVEGLSLTVDDRVARYPLTIDPVAQQQAYLKASNTEAGDHFGASVAVSGDTVVVGAYNESSNATGVNGDQANNIAGGSGAAYVFVRNGTTWSQQAYLKASNTGAFDRFGFSVSVSGDTIVVGANWEASGATGVNGNQADNSASQSGAAYVFVRSGTIWSQQAYLKASNTGTHDQFGNAVAVSGDTVVVGAWYEDSSATGVNGNQADNTVGSSGAAYVFVRSGTTWSQQAYLKASNTGTDDQLGYSVAASGDTVVVGAVVEDSGATGVNGNQADNSAWESGAAYVFVRSGTIWSQQAYLKASNTEAFDQFGNAVAVSGDTVVVGSPGEDSNATGVNGIQADNSAWESGAAYVFVRSGTTWSQQAYLKSSNTGWSDQFGISVAVSGDTVVVGAWYEESNATGVNGNQADNSAWESGAAYVFVRSGTLWSQQAYLKASNTDEQDRFGWSVAVSGDTVVIGALYEWSNATGVNGNQASNSAPDSGAAYVFTGVGPPPDTDGDGVPNANDNCPDISNPGQENADGDSAGDACDGCPNDPDKVAAGQCGCGIADTDTDGDGTSNCVDACPNDPNKIAAGLCGCGVADTDSDGDGMANCLDDCPSDPNKTNPGICGCGVADTDSDGDGTPDCMDACPNDPNKITAGQCGCGVADTDSDGDGIADCSDGCPNDPNKTNPGVCGCGVSDVDSDGDGIFDCVDNCPGTPDIDTDGDGTLDCNDGCPNDPNKIVPGICGCGVADTDSDGDGTPNCVDGCPNDPNKTNPGVCGCGISDVDSDGDGISDCVDGCPSDPNKTNPGSCGCGIPDTDNDGDGAPNCVDACPNDPNKIAAGQCGCGMADTDTDGDGSADCVDACPNDPTKTNPGVCGCGIADADSDGDGISDCVDNCPGAPDVDTDGDGTFDCNDGCPNDPNKTVLGQCGCGVPDTDTDSDGVADCVDGCPNDPNKTAPGTCGCSVADTDSDGDGTPNCVDACPNDSNKIVAGVCGCGVADTDTDGDGTVDCLDGCPNDPNKTSSGTCGCGVADTDTDGDGILDCVDNCSAISNPGQVDCNHNSIGDVCEIAGGAPDCNGDSIPDACQTGLAPTINSSPQSLSVCAGVQASFSVSVTGPGTYSYQWRKNGAPIDGATNNPLVIPTTTVGDAGSYDVVVTTICGQATSNSATLAVISNVPATHYALGTLCPPTAIPNASIIGFTDDGPIAGSCYGQRSFRLFAGQETVATGKLTRVRPGCIIQAFGPTLCTPESVLVDVHGRWQGVCSLPNLLIAGACNTVYFINPANGAICEQFPDPTFDHIGQMAIDSMGRLFVGSVDGDSLNVIDMGAVEAFYLAPGMSPRAVAIDAADNVYVSTAVDGVMSKVGPDGMVIDPTFAAGLSGAISQAIAPQGIFHGNMFVACGDRVMEVDMTTGASSLYLSCRAAHGIAFDPEGYMHISIPSENKVLKIGSSLPGDMNGSGAITIDDAAGFAAALLQLPDAPLPIATADMNGDTCADGRDVQLFVNELMAM